MIIYIITNLVNGKIYVGKTVKTLKRRWQEHVAAAARLKLIMMIHRAIKKYGVASFQIEEICRLDNNNQILFAERIFIAALNATDRSNGYNQSFGGNGVDATEEVRRKISIGNKGKIKTAETCLRISNGLKGKPLSTDHKRAVSKTLTGRTLTPEHRQNIADGFKGFSEEALAKMSRKGAKHRPETIEKQREKALQRKAQPRTGMRHSESGKTNIANGWMKYKSSPSWKIRKAELFTNKLSTLLSSYHLFNDLSLLVSGRDLQNLLQSARLIGG